MYVHINTLIIIRAASLRCFAISVSHEIAYVSLLIKYN